MTAMAEFETGAVVVAVEEPQSLAGASRAVDSEFDASQAVANELEVETQGAESAEAPEPVVVVGKQFKTFAEVKVLLEELKAKSNHPLRVFNSQSVEEYNTRRAKAKVPLDPVDKKWQYTYYSLRCVHYGEARKRSKGVRPNQRHFAMNCPVKLIISYDRTVNF